jgi:hypothetical protein
MSIYFNIQRKVRTEEIRKMCNTVIVEECERERERKKERKKKKEKEKKRKRKRERERKSERDVQSHV